MILRKTRPEDIDAIAQMIDDAVAYLAKCGVDQWQDGYPTTEIYMEDIEAGISYVLEEDGEPVAVMAVTSEPEEDYEDIDGAWPNDEPYCAIHRTAVLSSYRGKGLGNRLFEEAEALCRQMGRRNIRVDTHRNNMVMQSIINKRGYTYRGVVIVTTSGDGRRNAYHKILD